METFHLYARVLAKPMLKGATVGIRHLTRPILEAPASDVLDPGPYLCRH